MDGSSAYTQYLQHKIKLKPLDFLPAHVCMGEALGRRYLSIYLSIYLSNHTFTPEKTW